MNLINNKEIIKSLLALKEVKAVTGCVMQKSVLKILTN